jgi:hypothetical protein
MKRRSLTLAGASALLLAGSLALIPAAAATESANDKATEAASADVTAADATVTEAWSIEYAGNNAGSSPAVGDLTGDGIPDIVWGDSDGYVRAADHAGNMLWTAPALLDGETLLSSIVSSPTLFDLDHDGDLEIIMGVGSLWTTRHHGGLIVFDHTGAQMWSWHARDIYNLWTALPPADGISEPVYTTPAIGDIDGDGWEDIVFGGWDRYMWALDRHGNPVSGFPWDNVDTFWASPSLYDSDGDGRMEIFTGADYTLPADLKGVGRFHALDWQNGTVVPLWTNWTDTPFQSSGAIGDVNGDGRLEVIIGGGSVPNRIDNSRIQGWHIDDGSTVPGFPIETGGMIFGSPALGDLDGDGIDDIVVSRLDDTVSAHRGNGSLIWSTTVSLPSDTRYRPGAFFGSPVIADLDGNGTQDVLAQNLYGGWILRGSDGVWMANDLLNKHTAIMTSSAPTVADFGPLGWRIIISSSNTVPSNRTRVASYAIPTPGSTPAWPMWRGNTAHIAAPPSGGNPLRPNQCNSGSNPTAAPSSSSSAGYWILDASGKVFAFDAPHYGDLTTTGGLSPGTTTVAITETHTGNGYWLLDSVGGVHAFGDATNHGSMQGTTLNAPIISMAALPTGNGYWLLGADGGVFTFGAARYWGSTGNIALNQPVIDIAPTADGLGYWLIASDGGVFTFGTAGYWGSTGNLRLNKPIISMAVHPGGGGYWLLGGDGGVFSFGVDFHGSVPGIGFCSPPNAIQLRPTDTGAGYYALIEDGGIFTFGDAIYRGADPVQVANPVDLALR